MKDVIIESLTEPKEDSALAKKATGVAALLDSIAAQVGAILSTVLQPVVAVLGAVADTFVKLVAPVLVQMVTTLYHSPPGRLVRVVFWEVLGLLQLVGDLINLTLGVVGDILEFLWPVLELVGRVVLEPVFQHVVWPVVEVVGREVVVPESLLLLPLVPVWVHLPKGAAVLILALLEATLISRLVEQATGHNINNVKSVFSNYSYVESQEEELDRFSERLAGALQQFGQGAELQS
jgi:hypothetical protein